MDDLPPKDLISDGAVSLLSRWKKQKPDEVKEWLILKYPEELGHLKGTEDLDELVDELAAVVEDGSEEESSESEEEESSSEEEDEEEEDSSFEDDTSSKESEESESSSYSITEGTPY